MTPSPTPIRTLIVGCGSIGEALESGTHLSSTLRGPVLFDGVLDGIDDGVRARIGEAA